MTAAVREPSSDGLARGSLVLGLSSIVAGALVYAYIVVATRVLGAEEAAPIAVLWTWLNIAGAALTFPLEHWTIRECERTGGEAAVRAALPKVWLAAGGLALIVTIGALVGRVRLFDDASLVHPMVMGAITIQAALMGLLRGVLNARRRFVASAASYVAENLLRALAAVALWAIGASAGAFGAAILAGPLVAFLWLDALRPERAAESIDVPAPDFGSLRSFAGATILAQVVLTGPPLLLALVNGRPEQVTALFAAFTIFRLPHIFLRRAVGAITGLLTSMVVAGEHARLRRLWWGTVVATVTAGAGAGAAMAVLGPELLTAVFGATTELEVVPTALAAVGTVIGLGDLVLMLALLARGRSRAAVLSWVAGIVLGIGVLAVAPGEAVERVSWSYVAMQGGAFACMAIAEHTLWRTEVRRAR